MKSRNLPRQSQITLAIALILLALSAAQLGYRYSLPADGWSVYTTEVESSDWVYDANLVGAPSGLEPGDKLQSTEGLDVRGTASNQYLPPPPGWRAGGQVSLTVLRNDQELTLTVPLVRWTAAAWWRYNAGSLSKMAETVGAFLFLAIGWFTFLRRPEVPSARALLLLSTAFGSAVISGSLPDGLAVQFNFLAFAATAFFSYAIFGTLLAPSLLAFTLLFPRPKRPIERRPWLAWLPIAYGGVLLVALALGSPAEVAWQLTMGMILLSILSLFHAAVTQRDAVSRAQLRWSLWGFVCGLGLFLLNFPVAFNWVSGQLVIDVLSAAAALGLPVVGSCLSVAVLRYRLFDIDVIIRRTLVYTVLTALLALVYFGSVAVLQSLIAVAGREQSQLVIVMSTLAIAALVSPMRRRVQRVIDRRFYRQHYDVEHTLTAFAQTARDETNLERLSAELVQVVRETMKPAGVGLWMPPVGNGRRQMSDTGEQKANGQAYLPGAGTISADRRKETS